MASRHDLYVSDVFTHSMWDLVEENPDHDTLDIVLRDVAELLKDADPIRLRLTRRELLRRLTAAHVPDAGELADATLGLANTRYVETPHRREFTFVDDTTVENQRTSDDLIAGILRNHSTTVLYGRPDDGKTFVALGMGFAVTTGTPWCGRRVKKAVALYVIGEGRWGMGTRVRALKEHHAMRGQRAGLMFLPEPLRMLDPRTPVWPQ